MLPCAPTAWRKSVRQLHIKFPKFRFSFPPHLVLQVLVCSRKDCFTRQSPGLGKAVRRWPSPSQSSLGRSWKAAGAGGWRGASASTWLRGGSFPSTVESMEQSWASRLAANVCMAAWLSKAGQRELRAAGCLQWGRLVKSSQLVD